MNNLLSPTFSNYIFIYKYLDNCIIALMYNNCQITKIKIVIQLYIMLNYLTTVKPYLFLIRNNIIAFHGNCDFGY